MYTDEELRVADAQAVTDTSLSDDAVDLLNEREMGSGNPVRAYIHCNGYTSGGTTVRFEVVTTSNTAGADPQVVGRSAEIPVADLYVDPGATTPGSQEAAQPIMVEIDRLVGDDGGPSGDKTQRFLNVNFVVTGTDLVGATFTADFVVDAPDGIKSYPSGFSV